LIRTVVYQTREKLRIVQLKIKGRDCLIQKEKTIILKDGVLDSPFIKDTLQKEGFSSRHVISCLFRHQVGIRFFGFPTHDHNEINRMVTYQAAEILPLKPEETTMRYLVLDSRSNGYADTLVVVTHKEEVDKFIETFKNVSFDVDVLSLSSLAIYNCVKKNVLSTDKAAAKSNIMVVNFESGAVDIVIIGASTLKFSRGFLVDPLKNFSKVLISEIRHSIELFFNECKENNIDKIIVSGKDVAFEQIKSVLSGRFSCSIVFDKRIDLAVGLVCSQRQEINLLSNEFLAARTKQNLKKKFVLSAALFLINIAFLGTISMIALNNRKSYLDNLEKKVAKLKPQAQTIQNKIIKLSMLQSQMSSQLLILDAITDLVNVTSASCTLNMLSLNEQGILVVRGQTKNLQDLLDFVSEVDRSPYFKNSHLNYSSRRKLKDKEIIDFEIQARLDEGQK